MTTAALEENSFGSDPLKKEIISPIKYDATLIQLLDQRRANHLSGISKSFTVDEALSSIRSFGKSS